jgi:uncharacterized membrane protein YphA (DoxX/SURF4 family)
VRRIYAICTGLRIYAGVLWLLYGYSKLPEWLHSSVVLAKTTRDMIKTTGGPYHDFVVSVVLPHAQVFAVLIALGETLCGISLLLGLFGKLGGFGGMFLTLNYWLTGGQYVSYWGVISLEAVIFVLCLMTVLLPTDEYLSLGKVLAPLPLFKRLHRQDGSMH